ncbi:MAG: hypothetical protein EZS28_037519, partial [Streblomastix strix]
KNIKVEDSAEKAPDKTQDLPFSFYEKQINNYLDKHPVYNEPEVHELTKKEFKMKYKKRIQKLSLPKLGDVKMPSVPSIGDIHKPSIPSINDIQKPKIPSLGDIQKPNVPSISNIQMPSVPSIGKIQKPSIPSFSDIQKPNIPSIDQRKIKYCKQIILINLLYLYYYTPLNLSMKLHIAQMYPQQIRQSNQRSLKS